MGVCIEITMDESLANLGDKRTEADLDELYERMKEFAGEVEVTIAGFSQTGVDLDKLDEIEVKLKEMKREHEEIKESLSKELENDRKEIMDMIEEYDAEEERIISFVTQNPLQYMFSLVTGKTRNRRK